jgi:hypothetical protein
MKDREKFMLAQVALRLELLAGMAGKCECPPRLCKLAGVMSEVIEAYINNPKDNFTLFAEMTQTNGKKILLLRQSWTGSRRTWRICSGCCL